MVVRRTAVFLCLAVAFATLLVVGDAAEVSLQARLFAKADKNGDGVLSLAEFSALRSHMSSEEEPLYFEKPSKETNEPSDTVMIELASKQGPRRRTVARITKRGISPKGCYRVCPAPVVFSNGEPFGGPFGPDPYYSYGHNSMY